MSNKKTTEYVKLDDVLSLLLYEIQTNQKARESSTNQAEQVILDTLIKHSNSLIYHMNMNMKLKRYHGKEVCDVERHTGV